MQVNRNFQLKAKMHIKTDEDATFIEEMKDWFYSFTSDIESEMEEKDSIDKLKMVLNFEKNRGNISKGLLGWTWEFLTTKFEHRLPYISLRNYLYRFVGFVADNCFTESENSAIARDPFGPKPLYRLHVSCDTLIQHINERFRVLISDAYR